MHTSARVLRRGVTVRGSATMSGSLRLAAESGLGFKNCAAPCQSLSEPAVSAVQVKIVLLLLLVTVILILVCSVPVSGPVDTLALVPGPGCAGGGTVDSEVPRRDGHSVRQIPATAVTDSSLSHGWSQAQAHWQAHWQAETPAKTSESECDSEPPSLGVSEKLDSNTPANLSLASSVLLTN
eukprot:27600-Rhodomonas_salina.2